MNGQLGSFSWAEWKNMMEDLISIIRDSGSKAVPLVAGFNWAYDLTEIATKPRSAEGIGYVVIRIHEAHKTVGRPMDKGLGIFCRPISRDPYRNWVLRCG
jgi:hypothetical protein